MVIITGTEFATLKSIWEDRKQFNKFNHRITRWFESARLSTASISSNDRAPSATPSDCHDFSSIGQPPVSLASTFSSIGQRPVSLASTLSSGYGSSRDDLPALPPPGGVAPQPEDDIDLDLIPPKAAGERRRPDTEDPSEEEGGRLGSGRFTLQSNKNTRDTGSQEHPFSPFAANTMAPNPQLTYLDRVVMEIIETERMYVRDLRMIVEDYLAQIIDQPDLPIRPELVCSLFGNIEDIYEFNSELLQSLDMCDNDPVAIARCFVMKSQYFEIYTQYCTNYPNSVAALTECMRHKSLATFFREQQASLKRSLPLGSYLLKPVQRILKYHLLLQEIAKHFDPEEEGYEVVEEAIYTMTGVAWYINDMKRKHEHAVRLQEVQSLLINWKGPDLTMYGELVLEGTFKVHRAKNERTLFLFDRMLLITKRRGEHYLYKTHISCATLMLIESAKDSLCFSVTHYKHPKQPHTVQAKTIEERKLWAHHIKRIILENHQAIIPQKAKEAILEMDSIYPSKYRYSPERRKKAMSSQIDDFSKGGRQGRRKSEPTKEVLKKTRAILKHADSVGDLPDQVGSLPTASSLNALGSSLGESESERPSVEEEQEEEEEEEEAIRSRRDSLEKLNLGDGDGPGSKSLQLNLDDDSDSDDLMLEDDRVADFASSMLAAISCWHYRARALLTMGVTTNEEEQIFIEDIGGGKEAFPDLETLCGADTESEQTIQSPPEADQRANTWQQTPASLECDVKTLSSGESSEDEETTAKEMEAKSILPSSVLDKASAIAEHFTNSTRRGSQNTDDNRSLGCPSPHLHSRTGSTLSLGGDPNERYYRLRSTSSEPQENVGESDPSMLSPRDDGLFDSDRGCHRRRDSTLSKYDQLLIGKIKSYYDQAESQDAGFSLKRRESLTYIPTGLVRSSVSRFDSIPKDSAAATEKNLVSNQTNSSLPMTPCFIGPSTTVSDSTTWTYTVSSGKKFDTVECQRSKESELSEVDAHGSTGYLKASSQSTQERSIKDEEFCPSSEMIKVWQDMERAVSRSQTEATGHTRPQGAMRNLNVSHPSLSERNQIPKNSPEKETGESLIVSEELDLSTITEESTSPSPVKERNTGVGRIGRLGQTLKPWKDEGTAPRAPTPRVIQLRAEAERELVREDPGSLEDADMATNKVIHLARKYSQRIKPTMPVAMRQNKKILPCVMEENSEKESTGKPNMTLSVTPCEVDTTRQLSPMEMVQPPSPNHLLSSHGGSKEPSPGRSRSKSPLSPSPTEGFNWPDVRELRSKYVHSDTDPLQLPSVGRSRSIPERIDCAPKRRASCSSRLFVNEEAVEVPPHSDPLGREPNPGQGCTRLHRAGSLDHRLSVLHLSKFQELQETIPKPNYYISAEAPLAKDNSHKVIVMEKVPEAVSESESKPNRPVAKTAEVHDTDDNYVQIRSPTTREKISIMAVIDRCRAYQESDEYRQREEAVATSKSILSIGKMNDQDRDRHLEDGQNITAKTSIKTEGSEQSMVKNLRKKFLNMS
ncbi:pleckstrin homology domain-containing family G member 3 [Aplochiton taeniatus]